MWTNVLVVLLEVTAVLVQMTVVIVSSLPPMYAVVIVGVTAQMRSFTGLKE